MAGTDDVVDEAERADCKISRCVREGRYDLLVRLEPAEGERPPQLTKGPMVEELKKLLERMAEAGMASGNRWPISDTELGRAATCYRRASIFLEVRMERPQLDLDLPEGGLPREEDVRTLLEAAPWYTTAGTKDGATRRPRPVDLALFKHAAVYFIFFQAEKYRIFRTSPKVIHAIDGELSWIEGQVKTALGYVDADTSMLGLRGLLALQRGRLARALGGQHLEEAEQCLTNAIGFYEARAEKSRGGGSKGAQHYLVSSSFRAAGAILQGSYLSHLRGQLGRAAHNLKTARLLALYTENEVLQSEIELVKRSVQIAALKPADIARGDPAETGKLEGIVASLQDVLELNRLYQRDVYVMMTTYLLALCDMYAAPTVDGGESRALRRADELHSLALHDRAGGESSEPA
ncbi:MAG TPA: hypothetical protein VEQ60_06910, partial [Longimicrobium sp.]|nr:hypothetical protein [Longimicrobium sp.]